MFLVNLFELFSYLNIFYIKLIIGYSTLVPKLYSQPDNQQIYIYKK